MTSKIVQSSHSHLKINPISLHDTPILETTTLIRNFQAIISYQLNEKKSNLVVVNPITLSYSEDDLAAKITNFLEEKLFPKKVKKNLEVTLENTGILYDQTIENLCKHLDFFKHYFLCRMEGQSFKEEKKLLESVKIVTQFDATIQDYLKGEWKNITELDFLKTNLKNPFFKKNYPKKLIKSYLAVFYLIRISEDRIPFASLRNLCFKQNKVEDTKGDLKEWIRFLTNLKELDFELVELSLKLIYQIAIDSFSPNTEKNTFVKFLFNLSLFEFPFFNDNQKHLKWRDNLTGKKLTLENGNDILVGLKIESNESLKPNRIIQYDCKDGIIVVANNKYSLLLSHYLKDKRSQNEFIFPKWHFLHIDGKFALVQKLFHPEKNIIEKKLLSFFSSCVNKNRTPIGDIQIAHFMVDEKKQFYCVKGLIFQSFDLLLLEKIIYSGRDENQYKKFIAILEKHASYPLAQKYFFDVIYKKIKKNKSLKLEESACYSVVNQQMLLRAKELKAEARALRNEITCFLEKNYYFNEIDLEQFENIFLEELFKIYKQKKCLGRIFPFITSKILLENILKNHARYFKKRQSDIFKISSNS
ncbi:MAG: hypothetical protein BGO10_02385 [Chlamydia sp. 32-24]|nr:MAG: hypothetical protein BGO10_02385 [Chlamydia sp. 32-24]